MRLQAQKNRLQRKEAGLCKDCPNKSIPGQTRCEACRDKHNQQREQYKVNRKQKRNSTD